MVVLTQCDHCGWSQRTVIPWARVPRCRHCRKPLGTGTMVRLLTDTLAYLDSLSQPSDAALRSHPTPVPCANCGGATVSICRACVTPSELRAFESGLDHPSPVPQGEVEKLVKEIENYFERRSFTLVPQSEDEAAALLWQALARLAALTTPQTEGAAARTTRSTGEE